MSVRLSVMKQGKSGSSAVSRSLAASRKARSAKKSLARAAALVAPSLARSGGFSFKATGGKELNFVDTNIGVGSVSTTASLILLNGLAQGTTASTRIGRRVQMKSVEIKMAIAALATATTQTVRFALVLDKQANAAAPAFTDIYDSADPRALRNISNKARFWVLYDSGLMPIVGSSAALLDNSYRTLEFYKRINIPVQYNAGTAGTVGDIQTNALYWVSIGSVASGTGASNTAGNCRVRYDDS